MADDDQMGGPIERVKKGKLPIPTPQEIIKDKLKQLAVEHGWDALKWAWREVKKPLQTTKPAADGGGGGGALVALALVAMATSKKKKRR